MSLYVEIHKKLGEFSLDAVFEEEGEVLGLLGASGCGKSMTLKCIAGIEKPDSGRIVLNGVTLFDSERGINLPVQKRRVGYLFQNYALFPHMTVRQNILCAMHEDKNRAHREQELHRILELLQLDGLELKKPRQLSGGEQQRTALARILASRPALLMLDEPFSALDKHLRDTLQVQLKDLLEDFRADTLLVTHDREEAFYLCDKIAVMDQGSVKALKNPQELFYDPGCISTARLMGCRNISADAKKTDEFEVEVPAWGVRFRTERPVRDRLTAVGIYTHAFSADCRQNCFPVQLLGCMEKPPQLLWRFRYEGQRADTEPLWCFAGKKNAGDSKMIGVKPEDILLFYA